MFARIIRPLQEYDARIMWEGLNKAEPALFPPDKKKQFIDEYISDSPEAFLPRLFLLIVIVFASLPVLMIIYKSLGC